MANVPKRPATAARGLCLPVSTASLSLASWILRSETVEGGEVDGLRESKSEVPRLRLGEVKIGKAVAIVAGLEADVGTFPDAARYYGLQLLRPLFS